MRKTSIAARTMAAAWTMLALIGISTTPGALADSASAPKTITLSPRTQVVIAEIARNVIPHDYENQKNWGKTKRVVRGLYIKRKGLRLKTHRTWKPVNHGTWTKYRVQLIDPEKQFQIRVGEITMLPDKRFAFDVVCAARLFASGRLSQWQRGVQLVSLNAEADVVVQLTMRCELGTKLDLSSAAPNLIINPTVRKANLVIREFRLRRISQLNGPLVKTLSNGIREMLEDEFEDRHDRILTKINRQIDKNRDQMRLSLKDLVTSRIDEESSRQAN